MRHDRCRLTGVAPHSTSRLRCALENDAEQPSEAQNERDHPYERDQDDSGQERQHKETAFFGWARLGRRGVRCCNAGRS